MDTSRRRLSSRQTFVVKFVFPAILLVALGSVTLLAFLGPIRLDGETLPADLKWGLLAVSLIIAVSQYWFYMRVMQVDVDDQTVYVSNFMSEDAIPLRDIDAVTQNRWLETRPVWIKFSRDTDFGERIFFFPRGRHWRFWRQHPVVDELRRASERARTTRR